MKEKLKRAITSDKGESYIYVCVIVLVISMLVSIVIMYMGLMAQVQLQKKDIEYKLDSYISEYAVEMHDSIKQGDNYALNFNWTEFEDGVYSALGFTSIYDTEYQYPNIDCSMSRPTVTVLRGNGFGVKIEYIASYPIQWNGRTYTELRIPITVTSYYKFK